MKLTNYMRDAFIRQAMDEVPQVDYQDKARGIINKAVETQFAKVFPKIKRAVAIESGWLDHNWLETPGSIEMSQHHAPRKVLKADVETWAALEKIAADMKAQSEARGGLHAKLKAVAYSVTTRKALAEALPEFEKYLPTDESAALRSLPVVANVVSEFVKAGWPKGKTA